MYHGMLCSELNKLLNYYISQNSSKENKIISATIADLKNLIEETSNLHQIELSTIIGQQKMEAERNKNLTAAITDLENNLTEIIKLHETHLNTEQEQNKILREMIADLRITMRENDDQHKINMLIMGILSVAFSAAPMCLRGIRYIPRFF